MKFCTFFANGYSIYKIFSVLHGESGKEETIPMLEVVYETSGSMFSSEEGIWRASDSESRRGLPEPASTDPSDDSGKAADPAEDPKRRRMIGTSTEDEAEIPYEKGPIGWSNLQFGPNLQIP